jgi:hypothetical protein
VFFLHVSATQGHLQATLEEYTSTQDTQDQEGDTDNGAQDSRNTKHRRKGLHITSKINKQRRAVRVLLTTYAVQRIP